MGQRRATHQSVFLSVQGYEQPGLPSQYAYASQYGSTFVPAGGGAGAMQPLPVPGYYGTASCRLHKHVLVLLHQLIVLLLLSELCPAMATRATQHSVAQQAHCQAKGWPRALGYLSCSRHWLSPPSIKGFLPIPAGTQPDASGSGGAAYGPYQAPLTDQNIPPPPADNGTWALQQFVSYQQEVPPPPPD